FEPTGDNTANLSGDLTIKGVTKPVTFEVTELAGKEDPWGNFRRAWEAEADVNLADFDIDDFGGAAKTATVIVSMEATRTK
ncbi:MAG: YceI family protein, partial [Proteobacteria bacterium]|nr:YceI family protein [Pseudomonadota bacterium]